MRRIIFFAILVVLFTSVASADVIITQQPNDLYNLGDTINIPIKITTLTDLTSSFTINLICNGVEKQVYQSDIQLSAGQEYSITPLIILTRDRIERAGECVLKSILGLDISAVTDSFTVSDKINIELQNEQTEAKPGQSIIIEGSAIKENGKPVQGIINLQVINDNQTMIEQLNTVNNGYFHLNFSFPKDTKAGQYLIKTNFYELDLQGQQTNKGFVNYNLLVTQVPTSLEIVFENPSVEPGTNLQVKSILHDQTGESIDSVSIITIKNNKNEIIEQTEKNTGEIFELPIKYNEPASEWEVVSVSNKLTAKANFNITEKQDIEIILVNKTVTIKNIGNVPYCNKSALIKIGNQSVNIDICLEVDELQEYLLTAPEGEYHVEIISEGEDSISKTLALTGKAVNVKEISGSKNFIKRPLVWIFLIVVLGLVAYMFFKKSSRKSFFGYMSRNKDKKKVISLGKSSPLNTKNKAELSLSIKGDKQNISLVCLKIKNLNEMAKKDGSRKALQHIIDMAEEKRASVYENNDNLFFLLTPVKTKTFSNEKTALEIAQKSESMLNEHNKLFKDKLEFGIGMNYGTIIAKQEKDTLKFMSMGTLITTAKKTANISQGEILMGEKMHEKMRTSVKARKHTHGNSSVYSISEVKNREEHKNFLSNFVKRLEREKQEKAEKDKEEKDKK